LAPSKKPTLLTNLELVVMKAVWATHPEPITIREVVEWLNQRRRKKFAYTTVQTMMMILKGKGVVRSSPGPGRAHRYVARRSREEVTTSMIGDFVERLFDGEAKPLLAELVEHESVQRDELEEIKRLIEEHLGDEEQAP
jgi:predicted transcriptional regulator